MKQANNLLKNDQGFNPYPGGSYVPMSAQTQSGLQMTQNLASQPNPFYAGASAFLNGTGPTVRGGEGSGGGLLGGQYDHDTSGFQNLMGQNPNAIAQYGTDIASGAQGINTEGDYRSLMGNVNTEFDKVVNNTANDLGDQIQRQFGGASYGAPENADYLTKGVGDVVSKMRSDNFYNQQNLQRGLLGDISGVQGQNIGNRLGAAGMLSGEQQTGFNNNRGLLGDILNANQLNIGNRMGGIGVMDQVYNSQYLPAQQMLGVGQAYDADAANKQQSLMDTWNAQQQAPWEQLASAYGIFSGTGQQGNSIQSSTSQPTDIWGKLLGGGLLGSQLLGG
jgi:hypothetical protein